MTQPTVLVHKFIRVFIGLCVCVIVCVTQHPTVSHAQSNVAGLRDLPDQTATLGGTVWVRLDRTLNYRISVSNGFSGIAGMTSFNVGMLLTQAGPVGNHTVTVAAENDSGQIVSKQFTLTVVASQGCEQVRFETNYAARFALGLNPVNSRGWYAAAVADWDGDGNQDWLGAERSARAFRLVLGNATGGVGTLRRQEPDAAMLGVADTNGPDAIEGVLSADFNADGAADAFVATRLGVFTYWQQRNGRFTPQQIFNFGSGTGLNSAHDFNRDGRPDVLLSVGNRFALLLSNARLEFEAPRFVEIGEQAYSQTAGDFNGDGRLDLLVNGDTFKLLAGNGDGTFAAPRTVAVDRTATLLGSGDFNNDQADDLLVYDLAQKQLALMLSNGNGFGARQPLTAGPLNSNSYLFVPQHPVIADFNRDGNNDIAIQNSVLQGATVLLGNGQGGFGKALTYGVNGTPLRLFARDFNRDGKLDLAAPLANSNTIVMLLCDGAGGFASDKMTPPLGQPVTGDFNGDGKNDLAFVQSSGNPAMLSLEVYQGTPQGHLEKLASKEFGISLGVIAGDFTRDNKTDLVVFSPDGAPRIYRNELNRDFSGRFVAATAPPTVGTGENVAATAAQAVSAGGGITDFNADGYLDLGGASAESGTVTVAFNQAGQSFASAASFRLPVSGLTEIAIGDLDNDGRADLAALQTTRTVLFRGNGTGGFSRMSEVQATGRNLHLTDFNRDGNLDLLFFKTATEQLVFCPGNGQGGFGLLTVSEPATSGQTIPLIPTHVVDLNGDGHLDLIDLDNSLSFALGDGRGAFQSPVFLLVPNAFAFFLADATGDGLPDLLWTWEDTLRGSSLGVARNLHRCQPPRAAVSVSAATFDPAQHAPEMIAAVFGEALATTTAVASLPLPIVLGGTTVSVRDSAGVERAAPLFVVSPTQVNYLVPAETALGSATVTITSGQASISRGSINVTLIAPGIFSAESNGKGFPAGLALRINGEGISTYSPVARFDSVQQRFVAVPINLLSTNEAVFLVLYGTGWRRRSALTNVTATVGGVTVPVTYAGAQQTLVGLDQLNVRLPATLAGRGLVAVSLAVDGRVTNTVQVVIQ